MQSNKNTVVYHSFPDTKKELTKTVAYNLPNSVAILPFYAENQNASKIVTSVFYNYFSILPYNDVELSEIYDTYRHKMFDINTSKKELNKICKNLNVEGLIYGRVKNFGKLYLGVYSEVSVGAKINFYNCKNQKIIFNFDDTAKKREGGISTTPFGLVLNAVLSAYNLRKLQVYRAAEDLFRNIPKIIPHPKFAQKEIITTPKYIWHSGYKKEIFGIGDIINIKVAAEKNMKIVANIEGINSDILLKEIKDGLYEGKYIVQPHDNTNGYLKITCYKNGNRQIFYDYVSKIHIDTTPPAIPKVAVTYTDDAVVLKFNNTDNDIFKYNLLKYENNKFKLLKSTNKPQIKLPYINKTIQVKLSVEDRAKNSNETKMFTLFLYPNKYISKSKIYNNEKVINSIVRIENNLTIDELYIGKDGYLIIMPNVELKVNKLINDGTIVLLNAKLITQNFVVRNIADIRNSRIVSNTFGIIAKKRANIDIKNSIINSKLSSLKIEDFANAFVKKTKLNSKDVFSTVLISNNAYAKFIDCDFSNNLYNIISTSNIKTVINKKAKVKGNVIIEK